MTRPLIVPVVHLLAAFCLVVPDLAHAGDERAALAELRREAERRHEAEQAACAQRFAVTSCSEQARLRRRDELVALQKAEAALEVRERRAARESRSAAAQRPPAAASAAPPAAVREARPSKRADRLDLKRLPAPRAGPAERTADERRARAAYDQRQREAEARRLKVGIRNADRAASAGLRSAPLPPPPAASGR